MTPEPPSAAATVAALGRNSGRSLRWRGKGGTYGGGNLE